MKFFTIALITTLVSIISISLASENTNVKPQKVYSDKAKGVRLLGHKNQVFQHIETRPEPIYSKVNSDTSLLEESFEDTLFPPQDWSKLNPDGGSGWERQAVGTSPVPGWTGGEITGPPNGGGFVAFNTWTTGGSSSNDQWLVTPQITNVQTGDSLHFWMRYWPNNFADNVDILISTTGNTNTVDFNVTVDQLIFGVSGDTSTSWKQYSYSITDFVNPGSNIYIAFREHVADNFNDGASISLDRVTYNRTISTGIGDDISTIAQEYSLRQNYPNPFNPTTTITYSLKENVKVNLTIFNLVGEEIKTMVKETQAAGLKTISWNGTDNNGQQVAGGIYFYKLRAGHFVQTRKMILLK
jgi:hypothetical protein